MPVPFSYRRPLFLPDLFGPVTAPAARFGDVNERAAVNTVGLEPPGDAGIDAAGGVVADSAAWPLGPAARLARG